MPKGPFDDLLRDIEGPGKKGKSGKGKRRNPNRELVEALDAYSAEMREAFRPFTPEEKARLEGLMDGAIRARPIPQDGDIINRLLSFIEMAADDEDAVSMIAFSLGMAYERLSTKGSA